MTKRLDNRRILLTGAAGGIGRATAELFASEGAQLALLDRDVQGLAGLGGHAIAFDASEPQSVETAVGEAVGELGGIDGVVNAAGLFEVKPFEETSVELLAKMLAINLVGPFTVCRAALPHLRQAKAATIVNLGSASAISPFPGLSAYGASKGGLATLTKVLAAELAPRVRVNLVCPGMTRTGMVESWFPDPDELRERARTTYPMQRIAEPAEIAAAVLYLTSSESSYTTGSTLTVDGGRTFY